MQYLILAITKGVNIETLADPYFNIIDRETPPAECVELSNLLKSISVRRLEIWQLKKRQ